ncbi:MAG: hypothetical protein H6740_02965 [Alphaproteobacteria bacterium]|nr:hypothetical protein [Alphaproteobacteria bacterium]
MTTQETDLNATELLTRATSLLDLGDALLDAIEQNYQRSAQLREALAGPPGSGDPPRPFDPRQALAAHSRVQALVDHASELLRAQGRELETLTEAGQLPRCDAH